MTDEAKAGGLLSRGAPAVKDVATDEIMETRRPAEPAGTTLDDFTRTRLGTHLRAMYEQVVQQPVPDRFRDLIARLDGGGDTPMSQTGEDDGRA